MINKGKVGYFVGLPDGNEIYYDCPYCLNRDSPFFNEFGYQRVFAKTSEWFYFNDGSWNRLQPENPSSRYSKLRREI
jgi:hypothetical protein